MPSTTYCSVVWFNLASAWKAEEKEDLNNLNNLNLKMLTPHYRSQTLAPPVQAPPPSTHNNLRDSAYGRPVSSIYSQPSPVAATFAAQQLRDEVYADPAEISPPSSPDDFGSSKR